MWLRCKIKWWTSAKGWVPITLFGPDLKIAMHVLYPTSRMDVVKLCISCQAELKLTHCFQWEENICAGKKRDGGGNACVHRRDIFLMLHPFSKISNIQTQGGSLPCDDYITNSNMNHRRFRMGRHVPTLQCSPFYITWGCYIYSIIHKHRLTKIPVKMPPEDGVSYQQVCFHLTKW